MRSHFLVREGVRVDGQGNSKPTLSVDRIDKTSARWKRADILIFNTGHWWAHGKTSRGYVSELRSFYEILDDTFSCISLAHQNHFPSSFSFHNDHYFLWLEGN